MGDRSGPDPTGSLESCFLPASGPHLLLLLTTDLASVHPPGPLEWQGRLLEIGVFFVGRGKMLMWPPPGRKGVPTV